MKKILLLIPFLLITNFLAAQEKEKHISYYSNRMVKEEGYYVDKLKDGIWKEYDSNGKIQYERTYANGELEGPVRYYKYKDNKPYLRSISTYKEGKRHGMYQAYDEYGSLIETLYYENGKIVADPTPTNSAEPGNAVATTQPKSKPVEIYYRIHVKNNCDETVNLLLRYKTIGGNWVTKGWNRINPGAEAYIEDTKNRIIYYYATGNNTNWSGNENKVFNGKTYGFRKYSFTESLGKKTISLACTKKSKTKETKPVTETKKYRIYFENKTPKTIKLIVRYRNNSEKWVTKGWFSIKPGKEIFIDNSSHNMILYYARTTKRIWQGDFSRDFNGKSYQFNKKTFSTYSGKKVVILKTR